MTYLLGFSCNEIADGLAEKAGKQRVERRLPVQEVAQTAQQTLIPTQSVANLRHVTSKELTGCVGIPGRAESKQLEVSSLRNLPDHTVQASHSS